MTTYSLTLRRDHLDALRAHLLRSDGAENVAYAFCTMADIKVDPWDRQAHRKFLSVDVVPVPDDQVVESTPNLVTWRTTSFLSALKKSNVARQFVAIVHSHPGGNREFSDQDNRNELDLAELAVKRFGPPTPILSMVLTPDGGLFGRIWLQPNPNGHIPLRMIRVIGNEFQLHYPGRGDFVPPAAFQRQALAFGQALNQDLAALRVGVIGCGGTGSAVAMLLARVGVGQIVLIDNDIVDRTKSEPAARCPASGRGRDDAKSERRGAGHLRAWPRRAHRADRGMGRRPGVSRCASLVRSDFRLHGRQ